MKILFIHNRYQKYGGEDVVFMLEKQLVLQKGHNIYEFIEDNKRIRGFSKLSAAVESIWSSNSYHNLLSLLGEFKPDIVHIHNFFPLVSPSAYYACSKAGVPVVQTLHNYRLICPAASLFRDEYVCEDCMEKTFPYPGILHACYRNSRLQTAVVATMTATHRIMKTWGKKVNTYIALTQFSKRKFIQGGLPAEKLVVKPNFIHPDPGRQIGMGDYALYAGRLSPEKGVRTLLKAWQLVKDIPLKILGDGNLRAELEQTVERLQLFSVEILGNLSRDEVIRMMKGARFLVHPSTCYENIPTAIIEAFACGLPVIAFRLGAMQEIITDGQTGMLIEPYNYEEFAAKVSLAWNNNDRMITMGQRAREEYELHYTAERNYAILSSIYRQAIGI